MSSVNQNTEFEPRKGCCGCKPKTSRFVKFLLPSLLFVALTCSIYFILADLIRSGLEKKFVVTSESDSMFDQWQYFYAKDGNTYTSYYMYNLTNWADVIDNGATPLYEEKGPYTYHFTRFRQDPVFSDDGEQVTYTLNITYTFDRELSIGPNTEVFFNMNPAYMGAAASATDEGNIKFGLGMSYIGTIVDFLQTTLVESLTSQAVPVILADRANSLIKAVGFKSFAAAWANDTAATAPAPSSQWVGMLVANVTGKPTNLPAAAVEKLFSPNYTMSLLNTTWESTQAWVAAETSAAPLSAVFDITEEQVMAVAAWRRQFASVFDVQDRMVASKGFNSVKDLALGQWTSLSATGGVSVFTLYPGRFLNQVELNPGTLNITEANRLLYGPHGILFGFKNKLEFGLNLQNPPLVKKIWGLSGAQCTGMLIYFGEYLLPWVTQFQTKVAQDVQGLVARRTVDEWLFQAVDPTLNMIDPALGWHGHLFINSSSPEAIATPDFIPSYTAYTGKDNLDKLNWVNELDHHQFLTPQVWNGPERVQGTLASQFHFGVEKGEGLTIWEEDLSRHLDLVPPTNSDFDTFKFQDIECDTYIVNPDSMDPDSFYDQHNMTGFWNLTAAKNSAPVFVSNPHFYNTNVSHWLSKIQGVTPPVAGEHQTILQVEPITGTTFDAHKRSQVNLFIPSDDPIYKDAPGGPPLYHPDVPAGVMYPIVWFDEYGLASDDDVSQWKSQIKLAKQLQVALPIVFGVIAVSLFVMGVVFTTCMWNHETICGCTMRRRRVSKFDKVVDDPTAPLLHP